jgi:glycosyltransferase involved in cell wall biosynthesis
VLVSVVIPAFNESKLLPATLAAVAGASAAFTDAGWDSEVVVCDNNSTDGTGDIARDLGARVVREPVNMIARARNAGAAAARGEWLVFVDADSRPSRRLFAAVVREIRGGRVLAGGATVAMDSDALVARAGARCWNLLSRLRGLMAGSFIFVEAAAFREIGGFNTAMYAAEEIDLSRRLRQLARRSGRRIVILRDDPLLTSARKLRLYRRGEILRLLLGALFRPRATLGDRAACHLWYDGRR